MGEYVVGYSSGKKKTVNTYFYFFIEVQLIFNKVPRPEVFSSITDSSQRQEVFIIID